MKMKTVWLLSFGVAGLLACSDAVTTSDEEVDAVAEVTTGEVEAPQDTVPGVPDGDVEDLGFSDADSAKLDIEPSDLESPVESVRPRSEGCERASPSVTRCESFEIQCADGSPAIVDVAVFEPEPGLPRKGVVIFGSGGGGTGFYNFPLRKRLTDAGYTLLERRWLAAEGWFSGASEGPPQASCRLAALLRHYKRTLADELPLCATGNSGGSAELVYALTWHDAAQSLAFAMPTSGPFHRLDLFCQGQNDSAWVERADELRNLCSGCVGTGYQAGGGVITLLDASFDEAPCSNPGADGLGILRAASPDIGPSIPGLGSLPIHLKVGKLDEKAYAVFVAALAEELEKTRANVTLEFVDHVGHEMDQFEDGARMIADELLAHCK